MPPHCTPVDSLPSQRVEWSAALCRASARNRTMQAATEVNVVISCKDGPNSSGASEALPHHRQGRSHPSPALHSPEHPRQHRQHRPHPTSTTEPGSYSGHSQQTGEGGSPGHSPDSLSRVLYLVPHASTWPGRPCVPLSTATLCPHPDLPQDPTGHAPPLLPPGGEGLCLGAPQSHGHSPSPAAPSFLCIPIGQWAFRPMGLK